MTKVLGIGNALVDALIKLENDSFFEELGFPKGSMQLVDETTSAMIQEKSRHLEKEMASGGSAANTIHGLARLGVETAFIGTIGEDEIGRFFKDDLEKSKIKPLLNISKTPSGLANAMISKDGERTFGTFLGAAIELSAGDLKTGHFKGFSILHVEGYLVQNHELLETILRLASQSGLKISLDLASFNVVEDNLDFLKAMVSKYVDIIFANEEEAEAFTGQQPGDALKTLAKQTETAVVKIGSKGSMILSGNQQTNVGIVPTRVVDTTGAGDLYAAGFLFGLINNWDMEKAGLLGAKLASKVIEDYGAKISEAGWKKIEEEIASFRAL
ncbi:MAG: adenosine kinase [Bacteroidales bacterium]|nr:adenosine kinase [Bacteroidales bacterium]MCF6342109.1 adenosine kinase [Bacteroidales bacterium]